MSGISTSQLRALRAVRASNSEGRGFTPPKGSPCIPFKRLAADQLLEDRGTPSTAIYWLTERGRGELARTEGTTPTDPAVIRWPIVTTFGELRFDLVQKPETYVFALKRAGQYATPDKLRQEVAMRASQSGWVMFMCVLDDGARLYKLTTRAGDELPAHSKPTGINP